MRKKKGSRGTTLATPDLGQSLPGGVTQRKKGHHQWHIRVGARAGSSIVHSSSYNYMYVLSIYIYALCLPSHLSQALYSLYCVIKMRMWNKHGKGNHSAADY